MHTSTIRNTNQFQCRSLTDGAVQILPRISNDNISKVSDISSIVINLPSKVHTNEWTTMSSVDCAIRKVRGNETCRLFN